MFRQKYLDYAELSQQLAAWSKKYPDIARVISIGKSAEGPRHPAAHHRPQSRRSAPCGLDRRQHARLRGLRLERRARHGRGHPRHASRAPSRPAASRFLRTWRRRSGTRCSTSFRESRPTGRRRCSKRGRYVRSSPVNDRANKGHALLGVRRHRRRRHRGLHAPRGPGRRARGDARRNGTAPRSAGDGRRACPRTRARTSSSIPRGASPTSTAGRIPAPYLPLRQPVRLQPQFPVRVGAGAAAGRRGALSGQRARDARDPRIRDQPPEHLRVAQPAHLRRRAHPAARRQARQQDGPGGPRDLRAGRGVDDRAHRLRDGERLPRVPLRAREAAARRPHRLRVPPARRARLRDRAVGPLPAARHRAQEAVRRPLRQVRRARTSSRSRSSTASRTRAACSGTGRRSRIRSWAKSR